MKAPLTVFFAIVFIAKSYGQSICQTGGENATLTLTAPAGMVFISITFASYGTPNGSCGSFSIGSCHAANSKTIVEAALLNKNSASIVANNTTFSDPCGGTVKRLYIEAIYSTATPLELLSFSCISPGDNNVLQWQTAHEVNTREFIIERSLDGIQFSEAGKLASNNTEKNLYYYTDNLSLSEAIFYRLKMVDRDGSYKYSQVIRVKNETGNTLQIAPNPAANSISLNRLKTEGLIELSDMQGKVLRKIKVTAQSLKIDLTAYPSGLYLIKYFGKQGTAVQKIIKQ